MPAYAYFFQLGEGWDHSAHPIRKSTHTIAPLGTWNVRSWFKRYGIHVADRRQGQRRSTGTGYTAFGERLFKQTKLLCSKLPASGCKHGVLVFVHPMWQCRFFISLHPGFGCVYIRGVSSPASAKMITFLSSPYVPRPRDVYRGSGNMAFLHSFCLVGHLSGMPGPKGTAFSLLIISYPLARVLRTGDNLDQAFFVKT